MEDGTKQSQRTPNRLPLSNLLHSIIESFEDKRNATQNAASLKAKIDLRTGNESLKMNFC